MTDASRRLAVIWAFHAVAIAVYISFAFLKSGASWRTLGIALACYPLGFLMGRWVKRAM